MTALRSAGVLAAAGAVVALGAPLRYADLGLPFPDTVAHAILAYALTILSLGALPRSRSGEVALAVLGLGAASEMMQALMGREMSVLDFAGDATGVAAAYAPVAVGRLRELMRTHPHTSFADIRRLDPRNVRPPGRVLVLERIAEA